MIVRDGYSYILTALLLAVLFAFTIHPYAAVVPLVFAVYFAYFFRNPERTSDQDDSLLVSPADGTVMEIIPLDHDDFVTGPCNKIVIFMSVFDVHVNRSPMTGKVMVQQYICGRFKPAYKDSVGFVNERHMIGIANDKVRISVIQVAGILARRIVSWVTLDDELEKGERYGMIKFGSCLEIVVPQNVEVMVEPGQKTRAGETVIGRIN
ncbi:phosphatidylserine decarboxylase family protein [Schwartzia succinivorans]|uniref:Phosphatidylserine decarboxylase proenzyme n=1 Tax=Schwartzia succinivorans DSM 10502 TaxID=1123243 RepID=A0A1M4WCF0_9FIRM|nr:phosphatidylserine decarboxylase family protein [Schwartzia succinivorans]MBQ1470089.1 phosphatidylserine decarboxylase family protein [Schwartzia sp. (in: firmicutes)]MBE6096457.1 phosphatidylserine decarboxylase family protein [Schwartzia succinivorans]MBQ1919043.1 phosphatidylserine decarboxylase family protein [Schwartzia sp. (in: firmicutes)]MBQ2048669.1 phosphatidylserine decarboxylase family protein [Schwartzia sp. (in: firmicutes)]MBQ3863783.1 phosphatidylserine decarboxylase family